MFFASISTSLLLLVVATHSVSALPAEDPSTEESDCFPILKGHLAGFDSHNNQFNFITNSANEVAYDSGWKGSTHQIFLLFEQCPNYKDPIGDDDSISFVGRMYVPALKGCISNPAYLQSTNAKASYYPVIKPCDALTGTVAEDALWKYYPDADGDEFSFVYWAAQPNRLQKGCFGMYGYKVDTVSRLDRFPGLPYTRPGHNGAIEFKCDDTAGQSRFFVQ
ncbi:hypothetical protein FRB96_000944 [Tulasnella sp. 330]|nr:hypothetical protein FRB96_000944 [Tulasnella sp. 330]